MLGLVYLGGWWVFGLAAVAAAVALHEFWLLARPLSPLAPAGYVGGVLALVGAELGGRHVDGRRVLTTFALAFLLKGISEARQTATASISATVMGAVWIGFGLGFLIVIRDLPDHGRLAAFAVLLSVWAGDTFAYFGGRLFGRHKLAPTTSPGKTWEGFVFGTIATIFVAFVALYKQHYLTIGESIALGGVLAVARAARRPLRVAAQAGHEGQGHRAACSAATAACSTGSTRSSSPRRPPTSASWPS